MDRLNRSQGSLFREQSSLYRAHAALVNQSKSERKEAHMSALARSALESLHKTKKARRAALVREALVTGWEWLSALVLFVVLWYGALVALSEYACVVRGVC